MFLRALICPVNMCIVPTNPDNLDKYPPFQLTCIIFANARFMPRPMAKSKPMSMLPIFSETNMVVMGELLILLAKPKPMPDDNAKPMSMPKLTPDASC